MHETTPFNNKITSLHLVQLRLARSPRKDVSLERVEGNQNKLNNYSKRVVDRSNCRNKKYPINQSNNQFMFTRNLDEIQYPWECSSHFRLNHNRKDWLNTE